MAQDVHRMVSLLKVKNNKTTQKWQLMQLIKINRRKKKMEDLSESIRCRVEVRAEIFHVLFLEDDVTTRFTQIFPELFFHSTLCMSFWEKSWKISRKFTEIYRNCVQSQRKKC